MVDYESRVLRIAARLEKYPHGVSIRPAGVAVADVCGEDSMKRSRARAGGCDESAVGGYGDELVHELRPPHQRPTRRHAALRSMPLLRLGWTWSTSRAFSSGAFDSFGTPDWAASPAFSAAFDFFGASPPGWTAAISSSSVQIASRSRAIDASCPRKNSGALLEPARVRQKRKLGEMGHPPGAS